MLGYHPMLRRNLEKNGERAVATVLASKRTHFAAGTGSDDIIGNTQILWKVVPARRTRWRASIRGQRRRLFPQLCSPAAGERFPVIYDAADHRKVLIDPSERADRDLADRLSTEGADARIARMRGRGQNEIADRLQAIGDAGRRTGWSPDPATRRAQAEERRDKIRAIMAGPHLLVDGQPVGSPIQTVATAADALSQLAALRDRGGPLCGHGDRQWPHGA